jgi:hypothetical protein
MNDDALKKLRDRIEAVRHFLIRMRFVKLHSASIILSKQAHAG